MVHHPVDQVQALVDALEDAGFRVTVRADVRSLDAEAAATFDLVVVGEEGLLDERVQLCRRLRDGGYAGALVTLGSDGVEVPQLVDAGADDFAVAPISAPEMVARARIARQRALTRMQARWGPFEIDRAERAVRLHGAALALTAREYGLLACLVEAGGEAVSRAELLARVWGSDEDPGSNLVEVHLSRLRDKLGADAALVETVRRAGYRLRKGTRTGP